MSGIFDADSAKAYIMALFRYVLNRAEPSKDEVDYWTSYILRHQNAVDVLERFGMSEERRSKWAAIETASAGFAAGHFYSPIVDIDEAKRDSERLFKRHAPPGVDMNDAEQKRFFRILVDHAKDLPFSEEKTEGLRYYYNNTSYAFGDAFGYWGMLAHFRPSRIIEVGSGFTSALALDALDVRSLDTTCTFIDPYPDLLLKVAAPIADRHHVVAERVQAVSPALVETLGPGDILFIDSSHVVKTGSDVHFEFTELLPRLASGVIVHFHDVFDSFEYPQAWVVDAKQSWNEIYFLHVFLMNNPDFEIIFFNDYYAKAFNDDYLIMPPEMSRRVRVNPGGGLWLRKK